MVIYVAWFLFHFLELTVATLIGSVLGATAPAFIAIYLAMYSDQAESIRKQMFLTEIRIEKEIKETRQSHYEKLRIASESFECILNPIIQNIPGYPLDTLSFSDTVDVEKPTSIDNYDFFRNHIELEKMNGRSIVLEDFLGKIGTIPTFDAEVKSFKNEIKKRVAEKFGDSSTTVSDATKGSHPGIVLYSEETMLTLLKLWNELITSNGFSCQNIDKFADSNFPKDGLTLDKGTTVGDWRIDIPYTEYRSVNILSSDNLRHSLSLVCKIKKLFISEKELCENYIVLFSKRKEIMDRVQGLIDVIEKTNKKIQERNYARTSVCCPYPEYSRDSSF